jgi:general secretion pathway protein L
MFYLQQSLGIDFRDDHLKMVHLGKNLGAVRLLHSHIAKLPPYNIYSIDYEESIVAEMLDFTRQFRIKCDNIVIGLPRREIILRQISIPPVEKEDLRQIIEFEVERHVPFPTREIYFDYHVLEGKSELDINILLVAVRRDIVDFYIKLLDTIRLNCSVVDITCFSNYGLLMHILSRQKKLDENSNALMIDIGNNEVELNLIAGNKLIASRGVIKEEDIENRLNLVIESDFEGEFKENQEMYSENIEISQQTGSLVEFLEKKSNELLKGSSLPHFFKERNNKIFLSGADADRPQLIDRLQTRVDTEISFLSLQDALSTPYSENGAKSRGLSGAFALALRAIADYPIQFNLLPSLVSSEKKQKERRLFTVILLVLTLIMGGGNLIGGYVKERLMLKEVNQKIVEIKPLGDKAVGLATEVRELSNRKKEIDEFVSHKISITNLLLELTDIIPKSAWIERLNLEKNELELVGYADSASSLISILETSPFFEDVKFTSSITQRGLEKEKFKIKAKLEGKEIEDILKRKKPRREGR